MSPRLATALFVFIAVAGGLAACERELRRFEEPASKSVPANAVAAPTLPAASAQAAAPSRNPYEENAYAVAQGQRLFSWYNCVGCHAHGGGGSGPALMDDKWIYGHEPANVYASVIQGRPNGMPSFAGKIPEAQAWQIVAYVRSMSGLLGGASPGRPDAMKATEPPVARDRENPRRVSTPQPQ
jgi:cytochrome c oxidase cbb3-type subunit III